MVVYLHARLKPPFSSTMLDSQLKIDPGEVAATVWLQRALVDALVAMSEFRDAIAVDLSQLPEHIRYGHMGDHMFSVLSAMLVNVLYNK